MSSAPASASASTAPAPVQAPPQGTKRKAAAMSASNTCHPTAATTLAQSNPDRAIGGGFAAAVATAEMSSSKKPRLTIAPLSVDERAALDASLQAAKAKHSSHPGERVCVRSLISVDPLGVAVVDLEVYTPTTKSRAERREAKYQSSVAKQKDKKAAHKARAKEAKAVARQEREAFEQNLRAQGLQEEQVREALRKRNAELHGGSGADSTGHGSSKFSNRTAREKKASLARLMRIPRSDPEGAAVQRVVLDCSFDPLMRLEEICSLAKQVKYMYAANVRADRPVHLVLTSLDLLPAAEGGNKEEGSEARTDHAEALRTATAFSGGANEAAAHVQSTPAAAAAASCAHAAASTAASAAEASSASATATTAATPAASAAPSSTTASSPPSLNTRSELAKMEGFERLVMDRTTRHYLDVFPRNDVVYLTAESPNVLQELDPGKVYVIGGIVDHNRLKGHCHSLATSSNVATARLPIQEFLVNDKRTVITVNQVFEILLRKQAASNPGWTEVFKAVLPQRSKWKEREAAGASDPGTQGKSDATSAAPQEEDAEEADEQDDNAMDAQDDAEGDAMQEDE